MRLLGDFCGLEQLAHLTSLCLISASVVSNKADCKFCSVLEHLSLVSSALSGLHGDGLSACTALQELSLFESVITDQAGREQLARDLTRLPANLSKLTRLQSLALGSSVTYDEPKLDWVSELLSLQKLRLTFSDCFDHELQQSLLTLTTLTCLELFGSPHERSTLSLNVCWEDMQMLQKLCICYARLGIGSEILSLLQLKQLRMLHLRNITVLDDVCSTAHFAQLIHKLGMFRPEVHTLFQ